MLLLMQPLQGYLSPKIMKFDNSRIATSLKYFLHQSYNYSKKRKELQLLNDVVVIRTTVLLPHA